MEPKVEDGEGEAADAIADSLLKVVGEIAELPECRGPLRWQHNDMARRVKLLTSLFEELKDGVRMGEDDKRALVSLEAALVSARDLLRSVDEGSKIDQAVRSEDFANKFMDVTEQLENALSGISYNKLEISTEVNEQVELIHAQFKRAKGIIDPPDIQLSRDLSSAHAEKTVDPVILRRLSEKLGLRTRNDMEREKNAFNRKANGNGAEAENSVVLRKLEDFVLKEVPNANAPGKKTDVTKLKCPVIPDDFRCPIALDLMKDPVIVSTGQTYERSSIQKWLNAGHKNCPKTQQHLSHSTLTPNFVLKSLIAQWCESNGLEVPKQEVDCQDKTSAKCKSDCDKAGIDLLLQKLTRGNIEEQRAAAGHLRLLAKRNADNRVCIAEAGAIPLLVYRLSSTDSRTQEHAVTALLNLSINETNKKLIVAARAIPEIVNVLKNGSMEARENAAATLFSLSVIDANKAKIGEAGAIPVLIDLLCKGSPRGKKDAVTAIFNLSLSPENKQRAVKAGIVAHLMDMLTDPSGGMVDEALAVLALLATHQESKLAIVVSNPIPILVGLMRTGSPRNRENSAAILSSLCIDDADQVKIARECGTEEALKDLSDCGTERAKRKAAVLLGLMRKNDGT